MTKRLIREGDEVLIEKHFPAHERYVVSGVDVIDAGNAEQVTLHLVRELPERHETGRIVLFLSK